MLCIIALTVFCHMERLLQESFMCRSAGVRLRCHKVRNGRQTLSSPKMVLVVDDEGSVREVIKMALEAWGYGVWVAEDGEEALSLTKLREPGVVLSDVVMPNLDGLTLLRQLKRSHPGIAVILITAHPSIEDVVSAMKEGAEDVLSKPINFGRLRNELERLLGQPSSNS